MAYFIASCSCGKDSLAMVYRLMKENYPLDEIVFYDTGMEFSAIYKNWGELIRKAWEKGINTTMLTPEIGFLYKMLSKPVNVGKENEHKGYSWCGGVCRWGTTDKLKYLDKYAEDKNAIVYVGIAADELNRIKKERKQYKSFPLVDWGMTEKDCLQYCRGIGVNWREGDVDLYDILDRVSCWCCGNKNLWELYNMWKYLPEYWRKLEKLQELNCRPFKKTKSIQEIKYLFESGYVPKKRNRGNE